MKFYKRKNLDQIRPKNEGFYQSISGDLITDSTSAMQMPSGTTTERPTRLENGLIRYNETLKELEGYVNGVWERIRTVRPADIVVSTLGYGDYAEKDFGPLPQEYNESYDKGSANFMIYVENVYQIPEVNYIILPVTSFSISNPVTESVPIGSTTIHVDPTYALFLYYNNYILGYVEFVNLAYSAVIPQGTQLIAIDTGAGILTISNPTVNLEVPSGAYVNVSYVTDQRYIRFNEAPPLGKAVVAIVGFDGYFPPSV